MEDMPEHVSWSVRDAWLALPPCSYTEPFCHQDCPYHYDCYPEYYDGDLEDELY